jgi:mRNA interferase MazF
MPAATTGSPARSPATPYDDPHAILFASEDFTSSGLQRASYARPGKLFTANASLFAAVAGLISQGRLDEVRNALIAIIQG